MVLAFLIVKDMILFAVLVVNNVVFPVILAVLVVKDVVLPVFVQAVWIRSGSVVRGLFWASVSGGKSS